MRNQKKSTILNGGVWCTKNAGGCASMKKVCKHKRFVRYCYKHTWARCEDCGEVWTE